MGVRTGNEYLRGLRERNAEVWLGDERIRDVTSHPALRRGAQSVADLYDLQHKPEFMDEMTYLSPTTGDRVGMSFLQPLTIADLERRSRMMMRWARYSGGMIGRSPDYLNASLAASAAAAEFFARNDPRFAENMRKYYLHIRENDLALTHTLVNPQKSRSGNSQDTGPELAARIVRETDAGIVITGARVLATLGPLTDEILVFPSVVRQRTPGPSPFAFACAIPCGAPGLKFICRESFDYGLSRADHPLAARFEEMDALVLFDEVLVPWERVFLKSDAGLANQLYGATNAVVHMMHQVVCKSIAKAEFILGIACLMTETLGSQDLPQVQEKLAECMCNLEVLRACLKAGEAGAAIDQWGLMCPHRPPLDAARNIFPVMYPRMVEILQLLGSSSLMLIPPASILDSPVAADIDLYLAGAEMDARTRLKLFRLAWDVACSSFGGRQELYERFFFGDPARRAAALCQVYDKKSVTDLVREFLKQY